MSIQELWGGTAERSVNGTTWTRIEKVQAVDVPEITYEKRKRTSLDTVGNSHEFGKGRSESSPFVITCFSTKAGMQAAVEDGAREYTWYRLTLEDGTKVEAKCLAEWKVGQSLEEDSMLTITATPSGDVTVTFNE